MVLCDYARLVLQVLDRNLLPKWPETIKYQKKKAARAVQKTKELAAKIALRNAEKGGLIVHVHVLIRECASRYGLHTADSYPTTKPISRCVVVAAVVRCDGALRCTGVGMALRFAGQNFFTTSGSMGDVVGEMMGPRGLGFRLKDAALMADLANGKVLAKALIAKKADVNVRLTRVRAWMHPS